MNVPLAFYSSVPRSGITRAITQVRYQSGSDPLNNATLAGDPFNSANYPAVNTSTIIPYSSSFYLIPYNATVPDFVWTHRFKLLQDLPNILMAFDADDAIAVKNITTNTVILNSWTVKAPPQIGGHTTFSDQLSLSKDDEILVVSANAVPLNDAYLLTMYYIDPPDLSGGPWPINVLEAQPQKDLKLYCALV